MVYLFSNDMLIQESDLSNSLLKTSFIIFLALLVACPFLPRVNASETSAMIWKSPTLSFLFSVYMASANDGWAVGSLGTIIHWDGNSWTNVSSPTGNYLWSVFMVNANDGWAVGDSGTIIHWDGSNWKIVACPTGNVLASVFMVSSNDGWAVGWLALIHWNGNSWNNVTSANGLFLGPNAWGLKSVFMLTSDDGWAVGFRNNQDPTGAVAHWNGTIWRDVTNPASNVSGGLSAVFMVSSSSGWAVGTFGNIIHWDGENWSSAPSPTDQSLNDVSEISYSDGWAVGDDGTIIRWNGTQWIPELPVPVFALFLIAFPSVTLILKSARYRRIVWNVRVSRTAHELDFCFFF